MPRDLGGKLSKPAAVFDPEGRAFQFPQEPPGIAIKHSTDELNGSIPLFPKAEFSFLALKLQPVQPVIDDSHRGLQRRQESRGDSHGNFTGGEDG